MKLHLPVNLRKSVLRVLSALACFTFASGTTWASDSTQITIPSGYTEVLVDTLDDITPYSSSSTDVAFRLLTDLTVDAYSSALMYSSVGFWLFTSDSVDNLAGLTFRNANTRLFFMGNSGKLEFNKLESILFKNTSSYVAYGGAISVSLEATVTLTNNNRVTFSGNTASNTQAYGGAIDGDWFSNISLTNNDRVTFSGNTASATSNSAWGGAICGEMGGIISLNNNGSICFSSNTASSAEDLAFGGAIHGANDGSVTLNNNASVTFNGNTASSRSNGALGGAIFVGWNNIISLNNNGSMCFSSNTASSAEGNASGGAIFGADGCSVVLNNSGSVAFIGNTASSSENAASGGAIFGDWLSNISLTNNERVTFSGNTAISSSLTARGGAIYTNDVLSILNNGDVLFEKNAEVQGGCYRLRSIYFNGLDFFLSSVEGKKIEFRDSIYASSTVNLNADYTDAKGNTIKQTGDIIFTGATTEADLLAVKGSAGTDAEILNSRTSEVNAMTNLYGGRLRVEDGAVYQGRGITVADGANATLLLQDGTLNHAGYGITISSGSTLSAIGENTITASTLTMLAGGTLHLALDMSQPDSVAVLTTTGNLAMDSILLNLTGTEYLVEGDYKLLTRTEGTDYNISGWGLSGVTADQLKWVDDTLYYTGGHDWNHGVTDNDDISDLEDILGNLIINGGDITLDDVVQAIEDAVNDGFGHGKGHIVINRGGIHITGDGGLEGHIIFNGDLKCIRELFIENDITNIKIELGGGVGTENIVDVQGESSVVVDSLSGEGSMRKNGKGEMLIHGNGHKVGGTLDVEEGQLTFGGDAESESPHEAEIHELVVGKQDEDKEAKVKVEKDAKLKGDKLHVDGKDAVVTNEGSMEFTEEVKVKDGHLDNRGHISNGKITLEGGKVSGNGHFAGLEMHGGHLVVGNSPGVQTYSDELVLNEGTVTFSLADAATPAEGDVAGWDTAAYSTIDMQGNALTLSENVDFVLEIGGEALVKLMETGTTLSFDLVLVQNADVNTLDEDALAAVFENLRVVITEDVEGLSESLLTLAGTDLTDNFTYNGYSIVSANSTTGGSNIILHGSVSIPEPTTATLSLLALAALAARRRRK